MTNKIILSISLAVTIIHFVLTSVIGNFIAVRVGSQMGQVVASGVSDISNQSANSTEAEANEIYQGMNDKGKNIVESWRVSYFLLSLPTKSLFIPFIKEIQEANFNNAISKKISKEQFYTRGRILDLLANLVNSFFFWYADIFCFEDIEALPKANITWHLNRPLAAAVDR